MAGRILKALLAAAFLHAGLAYGAPADIQIPPYYPTIARKFTRQFPHEHLQNRLIDDTISSAAWTNYLKALDYDRVYFPQADIAEFRKLELELDDMMEVGDLEFAVHVYGRFCERLSNRVDYVRLLLTNGFDLTVPETYRWKRKDADWARDEADWNELWRLKIKNEYVHEYVRRELAAERAAATNGVPATNAPSVPDTVSVPDMVSSNLPADPALPPATNGIDSAAAVPESKLPTTEEVILKRYEQYLVVMTDSDADGILQRFMSSMARSYDPHSDYMSLSEMEDFDIHMKLSLVGIGALLGTEDGAAKIISVIKGGPADLDTREHIKLEPGDKIIAVAQDDEPPVDVLHLPLSKVVKMIRGEKGTRVVLTVIPASDPSGATTKQVDLIRDEVKLEEQAAKWEKREVECADGDRRAVAVVTLPAFYANMKSTSEDDSDFRSSSVDVERILDQVRTSGVDAVVLDLRNNGGGALIEAVTMTGLFIPAGPVVQVKERHSPTRILQDRDPVMQYSGPLIVLVNRLSASASEILAGALQDYGRAIVVGDTKTHGKGTVQTILELGRDQRLGAIKVTNAGYYRITGNSTQLRGVDADIVIHSAYDYMETGEEYLPHALECPPLGEARYGKLADLASVIEVLRAGSETRRAQDERFKAYGEILQRMETVNKTEEFPLDLKSRRNLADMEGRLKELEDRMFGAADEADEVEEDEEGEDAEERKDLVLDETLSIACDYAVLLEQGVVTEPATPQPVVLPKDSFIDLVRKWFRSTFS